MTRRIYMYSSIDSVMEMTSGNLVHGSCMVTHGSDNGGNASLRGRRKKGRERGREKSTIPASLFPFFPMPYPFSTPATQATVMLSDLTRSVNAFV